MLVSEIMTTPARVLTRDATVQQAMRRFHQDHVTAMPVVDGRGHLVGILSEADLLRGGAVPDAAQLRDRPGRAVSAAPAAVGAVMTRRVQTAAPSDDVADVARTMAELGIRSMPVLWRSRVVGVVSRSDVVGRMARDDRALEADVRAALRRLTLDGWRCAVEDGRARLWGGDAPGRPVVEAAARAVPGIRQVVVAPAAESAPADAGRRAPRPGQHRRTDPPLGGSMSNAWTMGVVVGVDGSAPSCHALAWAVNAAARHDGPVIAVATYEAPLGPIVAGASGAVADVRLALRRRAEHAVAGLPGAPEPGEDVAVRVEPGVPSHVLVDYSRTADRVVVGRSGVTGVERAVMGSTSRATAAMSHGRVAVVPPTARTGTPERVVVGVGNFDEDPTPALDLAFDEGRAAGRPVRLVHAIDPHAAAPAGTARSGYAGLWRDIAEDELGALLERWSDKYPEVERTVSVRPGRVSAVLLDEVTEGDLLVVGGRRHPAPAGRLLRSVPDTLVRLAPCPVVVVHAGPGR